MNAPPLLMTPGPVPVSERVSRALAHAVESHHDPEYYAVLDACRVQLASLLGCDGRTAVVPGSGRVGLEAAISTTISRGDRTLHLVNGVFGRWTATIAERVGATAEVCEGAQDRGFSPAIAVREVEEAIRSGRPYRLLTVAHCETSTGQLNPVDELMELLTATLPADRRPIVLVDAISSVPGAPLDMGEDGPDLCVLATQKALGAPLGLAIVVAGSRAITRWEQREDPPPTWAYDLQRWSSFDAVETQRPYPVVPSTHLVRALHAALSELAEEEPDARIRRHEAVAARTRLSLEAGGLAVFGSAPSPTVTPVELPEGISATEVSKHALDDRIQIVGGMGPLRERIIRVPHLGLQATASWQRRTMVAVLRACSRLGVRVDVRAATDTFDSQLGIPDPPFGALEAQHG